MHRQSNEEEIIANYFNGYIGTCLSTGENNGIILSNVRSLMERGWKGTLVEPSPEAYRQLEELYIDRDDVQCLNVAVADYCGMSTFYDSGTHLNKGDVALLSSLSKSEIVKWKQTTDFTEIRVRVVDFETLLVMTPYKTYDLISIDAEGFDLTILKQMNLGEMEVKMLIVEFNGKDKIIFDSLVLPQGFELMHQNAENLIYTKTK